LESFKGNSSEKNLSVLTPRYSNAKMKKIPVGFASSANNDNYEKNLVLTAYLEPPNTLIVTGNEHNPLIRNSSSSRLRSVAFPNVNDCATLVKNLPIDEFPRDDPFLPWIHDYFPSVDGRSLHFVAQNRRRCDTGKDNEEEMTFWAAQVSLFQGVPIVVESRASDEKIKEGTEDNKTTYRLASTLQEATHNSTRFQCRFHYGGTTITTFSVFPFDYELINWGKGEKTMFSPNGEKDTSMFWMSQLVFACPIPAVFQPLLSPSSSTIDSSKTRANEKQTPSLYVDLIPIRTPVRTNYLFLSAKLDNEVFDEILQKSFGRTHVLPPMDDVGRWQNLPICPRSDRVLRFPEKSRGDQLYHESAVHKTDERDKPYRLVACTWTSSSYRRRGEDGSVSDGGKRLREWIEFHLMVGVEHFYVYDNTDTTGNRSSLSDIYNVTQSFGRDQGFLDFWFYNTVKKNRPGHQSPGERSSQYAAESSCRERYGELTEWMTFIDTDEYMVRYCLSRIVALCFKFVLIANFFPVNIGSYETKRGR